MTKPTTMTPPDDFDFDDLPDLDLDTEPGTQAIATDDLPDLELPSQAEPQAPDVLNPESGALPEAPSVVEDAPVDEAPVVIEQLQPSTPAELIIEPAPQPQPDPFVFEPQPTPQPAFVEPVESTSVQTQPEPTPAPTVVAAEQPTVPAFVADPDQVAAPPQPDKPGFPKKWAAIGGGVLAAVIAGFVLWPKADEADAQVDQPSTAQTAVPAEPASPVIEEATPEPQPEHHAGTMADDVFAAPEVEKPAPVEEPTPKPEPPETAAVKPTQEPVVQAPRPKPAPARPQPKTQAQPAWQDDALNSLEEFERRL